MKKIFFIASMFLAAQTVPGQELDKNGYPVPTPTQPEWLKSAINKGKREDERARERDREFAKKPVPPPLSNTSESERKAREKLIRKAPEMVKPPAFYYERYGVLLKDKKTNLARLFIDKKCGIRRTVSVEEAEKCDGAIYILGGGSLYSFREKTNIIRFSHDLRYDAENHQFIAFQGIISEIGTPNFEDVNLNSPALRFIIGYSPKKTSAELSEEMNLFKRGVNSNGFIYSTSAPIVPQHTYVLRTIAYRTKRMRVFGKRMDLVVVFKIVGEEPDGSLVILWKELRKEKAPRLED